MLNFFHIILFDTEDYGYPSKVSPQKEYHLEACTILTIKMEQTLQKLFLFDFDITKDRSV